MCIYICASKKEEDEARFILSGKAKKIKKRSKKYYTPHPTPLNIPSTLINNPIYHRFLKPRSRHLGSYILDSSFLFLSLFLFFSLIFFLFLTLFLSLYSSFLLFFFFFSILLFSYFFSLFSLYHERTIYT